MKLIALLFVVACGCHRERPLPPATAHCGSGVGGVALCSEWAGDTSAAERMCQKLEGNWGTLGCPADVSAAGGTCTIRAESHTGTIRYASAWKGRAEAHCKNLGGNYHAPR